MATPILSAQPPVLAKDDTIYARHPRLHPEIAQVKVLERFDAISNSKRRFVKVQFPNGLVVSTHFQNVSVTEPVLESESDEQGVPRQMGHTTIIANALDGGSC